MQDVFIEYIVKKKSTPKELCLKALIVIGAIIVSLAALIFSSLLGPFSMIGIAVAIGAVYGGYYLLNNLNLEYEYLITNGEMDIDKIMARRSRKRVITVKCREFETFGKYKSGQETNINYTHKLYLCDNVNNPNLWCASVHHQSMGHVFLVFNATEKMLEAMKNYIPKQLAFEAFIKKGLQ